MASQPNCRFPHRHNRDGSHDSICISCYATVASVRNEADLADMSKIMYAIWSFSITLVNHAECQRSTVWRKGRDIPQFSVSASSLRSLVNAGDLRRTKIGSE